MVAISGFTLKVAAGPNNNTVFRYLHEVSALISVQLKDRWMGHGILAQSPTYMEDNRQDLISGMDFLWLVLSLMVHSHRIHKIRLKKP
jgi:hypothetical protein